MDLKNACQQAGVSVSRSIYGGAGLELAICNSLEGNIGGKTNVDSVVSQGGKPHARQRRRRQIIRTRISLAVLAAEDNKVNQKVTVKMLECLGHRPTVVDENGQECVAAITKTSLRKSRT
jgi:hypothetical protein